LPGHPPMKPLCAQPAILLLLCGLAGAHATAQRVSRCVGEGGETYFSDKRCALLNRPEQRPPPKQTESRSRASRNPFDCETEVTRVGFPGDAFATVSAALMLSGRANGQWLRIEVEGMLALPDQAPRVAALGTQLDAQGILFADGLMGADWLQQPGTLGFGVSRTQTAQVRSARSLDGTAPRFSLQLWFAGERVARSSAGIGRQQLLDALDSHQRCLRMRQVPVDSQ
jgi:hypothetical protein